MGDNVRADLADLGRVLNRYLLGTVLLAGLLVGCSRPVHGVLEGRGAVTYGSEPLPALALASALFDGEGDLPLLGRLRGTVSQPPPCSELRLVRSDRDLRRWFLNVGASVEDLALPDLAGRIAVVAVAGRDGGLSPGTPRLQAGRLVVPVVRGGRAGTFVCLVWKDPGCELVFVPASGPSHGDEA